MKRLTRTIIVVVLIAVVVFLGYLWRTQQAQPPTGGQAVTGGLPAAQTGQPAAGGQASSTATGAATGQQSQNQKIKLVFNTPVVGYGIDALGNPVGIGADGAILRAAGDQIITAATTTQEPIINAVFPADAGKVLALFGSEQAPRFRILDVASKTWSQLPTSTESAAWAPTGHIVAYLVRNGDAATLATLDLDDPKMKPKTVVALHSDDTTLAWPSPDRILVSQPASARSAGSLWGINAATGAIDIVIQDEFGSLTAWNGSGTVGAAFRAGANGSGGELRTMSRDGSPLRTLIFVTLPSKCAFAATVPPLTASTTLLCAVPRDQAGFTARALPDDYRKKAVFTIDDFYAADPATTNIALLAGDPAMSFDAERLRAAGGKLYFINRYDKKLYALSLGG
jgi:hypothetical protein